MSKTSWPVFSPFAKEHFGKGKAKGRAEGMAEEARRMVGLVLAARGLDVPADVLARIDACDDVEQLEVWVTRAVTAVTVKKAADLFA